MKIVHKLWLGLLEAAIVAVAGTFAVAQRSLKPFSFSPTMSVTVI